MKGFKKYNTANFNCTFGEGKEPMLNYFSEIIYPAFTSEFKRKSGRTTYFQFLDVKVTKLGEKYVLEGKFVKKTELEINSDIKDGILVEKDEKHSTAPYSLFILLLENHRLIYMRNQKGSPALESFKTHTSSVLTRFINQENKERQKREETSFLPEFNLNIVPFSAKDSIKRQLKNFKKIESIKTKLYPLNGEIEVNDLFAKLREELTDLDSNSATLSISSPKDEKELVRLITDSKGTAEFEIKGKDLEGNDLSIKDDKYKDQKSIELKEHNTDEKNKEVLIEAATSSKKEMREVSPENKSIYEEKLPWFKKLIG